MNARIRLVNEALVQIVPTTPPDFNGLAHYCAKVCENWPDLNQRWIIAARHVPTGAHVPVPGAQIIPFSAARGTLSAALEAANPKAVILHYVPHAYNPKGLPFWLPRELEGWRASGGGQLIVVFHELISRGGKLGPLYGPLSAVILRRLVRLSSGWLTTCDIYRETLINVGRADPSAGLTIPVGPNIMPSTSPQPREIPAAVRVVAFGLPESRLRALVTHQFLLRELYSTGRLEILRLLGASAPQAVELATRRLVVRLGLGALTVTEADVTDERISGVLLESDLGLCHMPPEMIGRSGVHAAYVAHRVRAAVSGDGLSAALSRVPPEPVEWRSIAEGLSLLIASSGR